tara:strand:- start:23750 stop:24763 length:1014 start_codon:yes stop_codon:yes gene_type:complete
MYHPVISDVQGYELSVDERALFKEFRPYGFILFQRNCQNPEQLKALTDEMREIVGHDDAPILIDQEGGRVARLRPPHWPVYPAAGVYSKLYETNPDLATAAVQVHASLMADNLSGVGVSVDCYPVADLLYRGADKVIGDRAYGDHPNKVSILARAAAEGMLAGGIIPVMKHLPGHGRADVDSHKKLPVVDASLDDLKKTDFIPFAALNDLPCAMTAHVIYTAIDPDNCATVSKKVIRDIIRDEIGFSGVLFSDDLSMKALSGAPEKNALDALSAGCDLALHCNGTLSERRAVLEATADQMLGRENRLNYFFVQKREPREIDHDKLYRWLLDVVKGYE